MTLAWLHAIIVALKHKGFFGLGTNTNKRIPVKWVRDRAKRAYAKASCCYICSSTSNLELHHLHSITYLLETWAAAKKYDISTDTGILAVRDEFIAEHERELYELVYTLCNQHHVALHSVYGKSPSPLSVPKQQHWIEAQVAKHSGTVVETKPGFFSSFIKRNP